MRRFWAAMPGALAAVVLSLSGVSAMAQTNAGGWQNVTSNLANLPSECGNLTMLSAVPGSPTVIAGVAQKGLWATTDGGASWSNLGSAPGSAAIVNRPSWITYDPLDPATFWESGIYNAGGAYRTTDAGKSFVQLGDVSHTDFISVDFGDPNRNTLLVGGHERGRTVWRSTDGGLTWTNIGLGLLPNTGFSTDPLILDSQTYVVNADKSWSQGSPGIFRTTDGGATWSSVSAVGPSGPPLVAVDGTIYWSAGDGLLKSNDRGVSWAQVGKGLSYGMHPIQIPDGRLVSATSSALVASDDGGSTWTPIGPKLPYAPAGVIYSAAEQAFYIWRWDCGPKVLPDAIEKLAYETTPPAVSPATDTDTPADPDAE